ncbi:MAG: hypothetical protein U9P72_02260 [Campylobacterota bacterium]|nr:hypothetical protein [Campylobacterota bacterium]
MNANIKIIVALIAFYTLAQSDVFSLNDVASVTYGSEIAKSIATR